jgi:hypothetical protein
VPVQRRIAPQQLSQSRVDHHADFAVFRFQPVGHFQPVDGHFEIAESSFLVQRHRSARAHVCSKRPILGRSLGRRKIE